MIAAPIALGAIFGLATYANGDGVTDPLLWFIWGIALSILATTLDIRARMVDTARVQAASRQMDELHDEACEWEPVSPTYASATWEAIDRIRDAMERAES